MKIAVLGTRGFPGVQGGVEKHCENLYPRLVEKGCDVVVFTREPYVNSAIDNYKGVKLIPLSCPKNKFLEAFLHTFKGIFAAKKIKPDILHIHAIGPSLFVPLARLMGFKVVITHHGPDYQRQKWNKIAKFVLRMGEKWGCSCANAVICVAEPIAEDIRKKYNRVVEVIPNGVDLRAPFDFARGRQENKVLEKYGVEKGKYVLAVGRFVPEKRFDVLIDAFKIASSPACGEAPRNDTIEARRTLKEWKLVIVGDADHEDAYSLKLKKRAQEYQNTSAQGARAQVRAQVILTGFLSGEPLQELYSNAGLFVLPSYYEGLPIVLLEAMSYGLSCVVSDIPANRGVGLSEDRFFVPGEVQALALKIKEFMNKPLSEEARKKQIEVISEKYDWEKIAQKTLEVYGRVKEIFLGNKE